MRNWFYKIEAKCICKLENGKQRVRKVVTGLAQDQRGIGVVEIILILVVLIALVVIFKSQLTALVNSIFEKITSESAGI